MIMDPSTPPQGVHNYDPHLIMEEVPAAKFKGEWSGQPFQSVAHQLRQLQKEYVGTWLVSGT
jgi:hypothetical protein